MMKIINTKYDVIIVGAGFAGLTAALRLEQEKRNFKILIIEADNKIGGRSFTKILDDDILLELGGQWIGDKHQEMLSLVKQYNLKLYKSPPFEKAKNLYFYSNHIYDKLNPEFDKLVKIFDDMAKSIDVEAPWKHTNAKKWDSILFHKFIKKLKFSQEVTQLFEKMIIEILLASSNRKISLLQVLFDIASAGGFKFAIGTIGWGSQHYRVVGGIFKIAQNIAENLKNSTIIFNEEVTNISDNDDYVLVRTKNQNEYYGKRCILAISPVVINANIKFTRCLPKDYQQLLKSYQAGEALKVHFIYKTPFWISENNLAYLTVFNKGWITEIVDNGSLGSNIGILTLFIYGDKRKKILKMTLVNRKQVLKHELVKYLGAKAKSFIDYVEFDWKNDSYTGGCFDAILKPAAWVKYGQWWKKPFGLIHFAGTETSPYFYGYLEGAALSGKRVTNEIIKCIDKNVIAS